MTNLLLLYAKRTGSKSSVLFADDFNRADGALGNGWTATFPACQISSGKVVFTPVLGGELLGNGDMEIGDPPTGWTPAGLTPSSVADEYTGGSGTQSLNGVLTATSGTVTKATAALLNRTWTRVVSWAKNINLATGISFTFGAVVSSRNALATWNRHVMIFRTTSTGGSVIANMFGSVGQSGRIDGISVKQSTAGDLYAMRSLISNKISISIAYTKSTEDYTPGGLILFADSFTNPQNYLELYISGQYLVLDKVLSGVPSNVFAVGGVRTYTYAAGGTITLDKVGTTVRVRYNGTQVEINKTISDVEIVNNVIFGMFGTDAGNSIDNFSASAIDFDTTGFTEISHNYAFISSSAPNDWNGRPVLLFDGTKWLMLYRRGTDHNSGPEGLHLRFSTDEGATWTADDMFTDGGACVGAPFTWHAGDGQNNVSEGVLILAPNGDILMHALEQAAGGTYQYRSTDGGKTWTDEGRIGAAKQYAGQQYIVIGTTIYGIGRYYPNNYGVAPCQVALYKSTNNGTTWTYSIIDATDQVTTELGIVNPSGNTLYVLARDNYATKTYQYTSSDLGATWSARSSAPSIIGIVQRPRLYNLLGGVMLIGREVAGASQFTTVWYSTDLVNWSRKFRADPNNRSDGCYCDVLQKADGTFRMFTYGGTSAVANVYQVDFSYP